MRWTNSSIKLLDRACLLIQCICINILHLLMSGVKELETSKLVNKTKSNCLTIYHALTSLPVYNIYLKSSKYRKGPRWFSKMLGLLSLIYILNSVKKIVLSTFPLWLLSTVFSFQHGKNLQFFVLLLFVAGLVC